MAEVGILKPEDRVELINGEIYQISPIGSRHAGIVNKLSKIFNDLFKDQAIVAVQNPIRVDANNELEPDIALLKFKPDYYASDHPAPSEVLALIEVAGASIRFDREVKKALYAACAIRLYWIINIENNQIEAYSTPTDDKYSTFHLYKKDDNIPLLDKRLNVNELILLS